MKGSSSNSSRLRPRRPRRKKGRTRGSPLRFILFALIFLFASRAEARIYIQIDQPSEKKFPIAVVDLVAADGEDKNWSRKVSEIIRKDLGLTGLFDLIPPDQFPTSPGARNPNPGAIQFPPWSLVGAQALVIGSYQRGKDGMRVEMHLYDPFLGQHIVARTYNSKKNEYSVVANNFADEIMNQLTGEPGVFSTKIAYVQAGKKGKEIGVMDMNGLSAGQITKDKTISLSPAFGPDGRIAYSILSRNGSWEINLVGGKRITANGGVNVSPAWTPGGGLVVATSTEGDSDIYNLSMSGQLGKRIAGGYGIDVNPSFAPDGSDFVFASERAGRLHLFRGSGERLTFVGLQNDNPVWSPKGDKIAFQSLAGGWDIFIMNTDGSMIQRLTSRGNCESPTWAPNGRFIAASCGGRIHLMREDGTNLTPVGPGGSLQPSWGPQAK